MYEVVDGIMVGWAKGLRYDSVPHNLRLLFRYSFSEMKRRWEYRRCLVFIAEPSEIRGGRVG